MKRAPSVASSSRACCSCTEPLEGDSGLKCAANHFTCTECVNGLSKVELGAEGVRKHKGVVRCPWRGVIGAGKAETCKADPWNLSDLRPHLTRDALLDLLAEAHTVVEQATKNEEMLARKVTEAESAGGGVAARAAAASKDAEGMAVAERLRKHRNAIVESVLTLHCPRCSAAFLDYVGCDAVTCLKPGCGAAFCALCLKDCGSDAHAHVLEAKHHVS